MRPDHRREKTKKEGSPIGKGLSDVDQIKRIGFQNTLQSRDWKERSQKVGNQEDKVVMMKKKFLSLTHLSGFSDWIQLTPYSCWSYKCHLHFDMLHLQYQ